MNENILSVRDLIFFNFLDVTNYLWVNPPREVGLGRWSWVPCDGVLFVKEIVLHYRVIIQTEDKLLLHVPQDVFS